MSREARVVQADRGARRLSPGHHHGRAHPGARVRGGHRAGTTSVMVAMRQRARFDERGAALVVTLVVLLVMGGLLATYLAVSALEPQISRNLADASRARHLAEAGVERGFNVLIGTPDAAGGWSGLLAGATNARPWVSVAGLANVTLTGTANAGTFSVSVRNDNGASDTPITGLTGSTQPRMDTSPTADDNATVIMRSTGTFNRV